jgi:hypothetical protein
VIRRTPQLPDCIWGSEYPGASSLLNDVKA